MANREYGVDVSAYQGQSMTDYHDRGAKFVIVKATEGTWYKSPTATAQIRSAHHNRMRVHAYHFANFSSSKWAARREAKFFIARAKQLGISKSRYLCLDWESSPYNYVQGNSTSNTNAIITFMQQIKKAGYRAMLYSGASLLKNNIQVNRVIKQFGDVVWSAAYTTMGRIDSPNFGYFPSMSGIAIWQFTDNWKGMNVDGNITVLDLYKPGKAKAKPKPLPANTVEKKTSGTVYAPIINNDPRWEIALCNDRGHVTGKYIRTGTKWKLIGEKRIRGELFYRLGTQKQWVRAKYLKKL